jgi:DNA replication protein DnaC
MALENCPHCHGTGWKLVPRKDGLANKVAVACGCGAEDRATQVFARAHIPKRYEHCDFDSFVTDLADGKIWTALQVQSLKQAKLQTEGFARNYPAGSEAGLLLMGPSGIGKTHLAVAGLRELLHRGHNGLFCDYRELLKEIQGSYNAESQTTEMSVLEPVRTAEILVLDDLGASKPSAWVLDIIGLILNARYNERRVTILTTNFADETLGGEGAQLPSRQRVVVREDSLADRIGARIRSRLYEMCKTLELTGPDFRREVRTAGRARA